MENELLRDIAKHGALLHSTQHGNFVLTELLQRQFNTTPAMRGIRPA
jgi:hypothetical protein